VVPFGVDIDRAARRGDRITVISLLQRSKIKLIEDRGYWKNFSRLRPLQKDKGSCSNRFASLTGALRRLDITLGKK